jgi:hypothetical protein
MTLAQLKHRPAFPVINGNIGSGQYMPAPIEVPAGIFITLFRPFTWGFLIGPDVGLAWKWWGLSLGLFYSFFLVFMLVSGNRFGLSAWASFGIVASPYFQFWSLHKAEIAIHWAGMFVAGACLLAARRTWLIWAAGAALGWSAAAIALDQIYPPIAVSLGWLLPFAAGAWVWERRLDVKDRAWHRIGASALAMAVAGVSLAEFFMSGAKYIRLIRETTYPGIRFSTGGDQPLWAMLSHDFFAQAWDQGHPWLGNICEDSSFFFIFPALVLLLTALAVRRRRIFFEPWIAFLAIYVAAQITYAYAGISPWLARLTLMGMSTGDRVQLGLGIANQLMLVAVCSNVKLRAALTPGVRWAAALGWLLLLLAWGSWFRAHWPDLSLAGMLLGIGFQALLVFFLWIWERPTLAVALLGLASCAYTFWFNPWVRGGSDFILHNPLSNEIRSLSKADPSARWVAYGNVELGNLPRILGVKSIGGFNGYPDFEVWDSFDPDGTYRSVYNQAAYTAFKYGGVDPIFESPQSGLVLVEVDPLSSAFERAGVRYFLVSDRDEVELFRSTGRLKEVFDYAGRAIFVRP